MYLVVVEEQSTAQNVPRPLKQKTCAFEAKISSRFCYLSTERRPDYCLYRVFIKYCVFSLKFSDFSEVCQFCCSAGVLPAWCVYTH